MKMYDRDTAEVIRELTHDESSKYLDLIGDDPCGFVARSVFDPGQKGIIYAI